MNKLRAIIGNDDQDLHPQVEKFDRAYSENEFKKYEIYRRKNQALFCIIFSLMLDIVYDYQYLPLNKEQQSAQHFYGGEGPYIRMAVLLIMVVTYYLTYKEQK